MRRLAWALGLVSILAIAAVVFVKVTQVAPLQLVEVQQLDVPKTVPVGESAEIAVYADPVGDIVQVGLQTGRTSRLIEVPLRGGEGSLVLGSPETQLVGAITVTSGSGRTRIARDIVVEPTNDVAELELLVNGRRLLQGDEAIAIVVASDEWGNPVIDGVVVDVTIATTNPTKIRATTRGGRAVVPLPIPDQPGDYLISAIAAATTQREETRSNGEQVTRLPGPPRDIELIARSSQVLVADGSSRIEIDSELVVDKHDAPLVTGTAVSLRISAPDGASTAVGQIRNGRVSATLLAPEMPGTMSITPIIDSVAGPPLELDFLAAVQPFGCDITPSSDGVRVTIGPVHAWHGGLAADGIVASVGNRTVPLIAGYGSVVLPVGAGLDVSVLGVEGTPS